MVKKNSKVATIEEIEEEIVLPPLTSFIETDCVGFDLALTNGKGLPEGGNILLFAPPGCGKTTLISDVVRRLLAKHECAGIPFRVVYIDSENSLTLLNCIGKDPKNPNELGLQKYITVVPESGEIPYKPQQLIYYPNLCSFKEAEEVYNRFIEEDNVKENKDIKIIVVDSLTNLISSTLLEADVDKADYGSNARERLRFYQKWMRRTRNKGITVLYTSQMRQKQNASAYEDPLRAAVTKADEHNMDIIAKLSKSTDSKKVVLKKVKQHTIDGVIEKQTRYILKMATTKVAGAKNRVWDAVDVEMLVKPGCKILNAFTVFNMLVENGFYKKLNATTFQVAEEFKVAFADIDLSNTTIDKKELMTLTSLNIGRIVEYLRNNGMYTAVIGELEELDDGILC